MIENAIVFFENFCKNYEIKKEDDMKSTYSHKYYHTYRVQKWMKSLTKKLKITQREKDLAIITAIFHDLGRFIQLEKYNQYNDHMTKFDHGKESVRILKENNWFSKNKIKKEEEVAICFAIYNHNKIKIEKNSSKLSLLLAKLIRDADKLAIIEECYHFDSFTQIKEYGKISSMIKKQFQNHQLLNIKDVKTLEDEICYYLAYIFDFNFLETMALLKKNHLLDSYFEILEQKGSKRIKEKIKKEINLFLNHQFILEKN